jgi:outer membrane receptor protein involved in Fe transport
VRADAYYNTVKNKIVAIPTKNLFNWSMQNIGRTEALGCDLSVTLLFKKGFWRASLNSNHSFSSITDITNPDSPSHGHQIPYTPTYSSSSSFILSFKGYGISFNGLYAGKRYSLNENIKSNLLAPYFDLNLGIQKIFEFKNDLDAAVSLKCMNILNKNYEIIRSFPMPGRFYQLTLNLSFK